MKTQKQNASEQWIQIGGIKIDRKVSEQFLTKFKKNYAKYLNNNKLSFQGIFFYGYDKVLPFVLELQCSLLQFWQISSAIKCISKISFTQLQFLDISRCFITTIEELPCLNIPVIQHVWIFSNNITISKSFNKCRWDSLKDLKLGSNPFRKLEIQRFRSKNSLLGTQIQVHQLNEQKYRSITMFAKINFEKVYSGSGFLQKHMKKKSARQSLNRKGIKFIK